MSDQMSVRQNLGHSGVKKQCAVFCNLDQQKKKETSESARTPPRGKRYRTLGKRPRWCFG